MRSTGRPSEAAPAPRLGVLYPGPDAAVDDYRSFAAASTQPVELIVMRMDADGPDTHLLGDLLEYGSITRLTAAARPLREARVDAVLWACTSAGFVHGTEGVQRQIDALAAEVGVPATSTSHAFVRAVRALGADSVYLLAPYPDEIAQLFVDFLGASGITVSHRVALGSPGGTASAALRRETFSAALAALAPPPTAIVVMPDTAVHGLALGPDLAQLTEATVLTANQVTIWHGLQLAGSRPVDTRLGALSDVVAID